MTVAYQSDGSVHLTEVYQDSGEEVPNGRTLTIPAGTSKADQDAAILAFVQASPAHNPNPQQ